MATSPGPSAPYACNQRRHGDPTPESLEPIVQSLLEESMRSTRSRNLAYFLAVGLSNELTTCAPWPALPRHLPDWSHLPSDVVETLVDEHSAAVTENDRLKEEIARLSEEAFYQDNYEYRLENAIDSLREELKRESQLRKIADDDCDVLESRRSDESLRRRMAERNLRELSEKHDNHSCAANVCLSERTLHLIALRNRQDLKMALVLIFVSVVVGCFLKR